MRHALVALAALLIAASCARDDRVVIVAFGDSTTTWKRPSTNWVEQLRSRLPDELDGRTLELIDAGVSSNTTDLARDRLWWDVVRHRPDVTIVQFGINDALIGVRADPPARTPRVPLERYEANLRHFVETLNGWGSRVVLLTPNPLAWHEYTRSNYGAPPYDVDHVRGMNVVQDAYADAVRRLATETGTPLVDVQRLFERIEASGGPRIEELLMDGVHPNDRAHRLIADALEPPLLAAVAR